MSHVLSLLPIRLDILLVRGKAAPLRATFAHPDTAVPYDITLDTITLTVRDGYTGAVLFTKSNAPGAHEDPENGVTVLDITAADVADPGNEGVEVDYTYAINRIEPGGAATVFWQGIFRLKPTV